MESEVTPLIWNTGILNMVCKALPPSAMNMTLIIQTMRDGEGLTRQSEKKYNFQARILQFYLILKNYQASKG